MENISKHISYKEATRSFTAIRQAIDNTPNEIELAAMKLVANELFEPLRVWYNKPININSFYRSEKLNKAVGGASKSQHKKGEAIDISAGSKEENKKLFDYIKKNLKYDQVISEYDYKWIHISYKTEGNRQQTLAIK